MSKNILRLLKGSVIPHQDFLELEFGIFLSKSMLNKCYTECHKEVEINRVKYKGGEVRSYYVHRDDGVFVLDNDYEIIIRRVSKKRKEKESAERVIKMLKQRSNE